MSATNIQLRIERIEIKSFSMTNETLRFKPTDTFTVSFGFAVDLPDENGKVKFNLDMVSDKKSENGYSARLAEIKTVSTFTVKNHKEFLVQNQEGSTQIDGSLVKTLMELCMHQLRGAWAAKTEGTPIESIVIPLLNIDRILENSRQRQSS